MESPPGPTNPAAVISSSRTFVATIRTAVVVLVRDSAVVLAKRSGEERQHPRDDPLPHLVHVPALIDLLPVRDSHCGEQADELADVDGNVGESILLAGVERDCHPS